MYQEFHTSTRLSVMEHKYPSSAVNKTEKEVQFRRDHSFSSPTSGRGPVSTLAGGDS